MNQTLKIAIADDEVEILENIQEILVELGHEVIVAARTGRELVERCQGQQPDLIITDIKMPDMDGLEATKIIGKESPTPVILVSAYHDQELIDRALLDHVLAYLIKPIKLPDLETAIALVARRFKEFQALQKETDNLRQSLEDRKIIERAKGVLMKRAGLDEQDAFRRLQKLSSDKNTKMIEIAQTIVTADEAFGN